MEKDKIEGYYQNEAKRFVDNLYDAGTFNPKFSRDNLQSVEDLVAYYLQSYAHTAKRMVEFSKSVEHLKR